MNKNLMIGAAVILLLIFMGGIFCAIKNGKKSIKLQRDVIGEYLQEGKYNEAIEALKKLIEIIPGDIDARLVLAGIYIAEEDYRGAEEILKEALEWNNTRCDIYERIIDIQRESEEGIQDRIDFIRLAYKRTHDEKFLERLVEYEPDSPLPSRRGGIYRGPLNIKLKAGNGEQIFYTIDGRDPIRYGTSYIRGINLKKGKLIIRAVALNKYDLFSEVANFEYRIDKRVILDEKYRISFEIP